MSELESLRSKHGDSVIKKESASRSASSTGLTPLAPLDMEAPKNRPPASGSKSQTFGDAPDRSAEASESPEKPHGEIPLELTPSPAKASKTFATDTSGSLPAVNTDKTVGTADDTVSLRDVPGPSPLSDFEGSSLTSVFFSVLLICIILGTGAWLFQSFIRRRMQNSKLPVSIIGQTHLDPATRIIFLKVSNKVLVVAKSAQFCNTLDIITDPDEINMITLGSGIDHDDEGFKRVMSDIRSKLPKDNAQSDQGKLRNELEQIKGRLENLR